MWPEDYNNPNTGPEHPEEELAAFALNALDDAEFQAVFHHVIRCPHCQEVLLGFQETAARLTEAAPETPLPPGLKSRVLGAVVGAGQSETSPPAVNLPPADARWSLRRLRRWVVPTAIGALSLLLAASIGVMVSQQREIGQLSATVQMAAEQRDLAVVPAPQFNDAPAREKIPGSANVVAPDAGRVESEAAAASTVGIARVPNGSMNLTPNDNGSSDLAVANSAEAGDDKAVVQVQQEMSDVVQATVMSAQPETEKMPMTSPMGTEPEARGVLMVDPSGTQGVLMVSGMPADSYQIWLVRGDKRMLVDRIVVNENDGNGVKQLELDESVFGFHEVALMPDERHGPTAPTGEKFLSARIIAGPPLPQSVWRGR